MLIEDVLAQMKKKPAFGKLEPVAKRQISPSNKLVVEWPNVPEKQPEKKYWVATSALQVKEYLLQAKKTGWCSFDFETAPTAAAKMYYEGKLDELLYKQTLAKNKAEYNEYEAELKELRETIQKLALDVHSSRVVTMSISVLPHEACVIFLDADCKTPEEKALLFMNTLDRDTATGMLLQMCEELVFKDDTVIKVAANATFEGKFCMKYGTYIGLNVFDPIIASVRCLQLLSPEEISGDGPKGFGLKAMALRFLNHQMMSFKLLVGSDRYFDELSIADHATVSYSAEDSDYALQLAQYFMAVAKQIPIRPTYESKTADGETVILERPYKNYYEWLAGIEMPFTQVTAMMEFHGLKWNEQFAAETSAVAQAKMTEIQNYIRQFGVEPGSSGNTNAMKDYLFGTLGAPQPKTSEKTGKPSMDLESLIDIKFMVENGLETLDDEKLLANPVEKERMLLRNLYPESEKILQVIGALSKLKKYNTLLGTHITGRGKWVNPFTGRIHASYGPWTNTSRLSSSEPNGQNVPRPDNDEFGIRNLYQPEKGNWLYLIDFSGFELRLIAWLADETTMLQLFRDGGDLHKRTASFLFNKPEAAVTKLERNDGKTGNFLNNYGGSAHALQVQYKEHDSRKTIDECQKVLDAVDRAYPQLKVFRKNMAAFAQDHGYSETVFGYKRKLVHIDSMNLRDRKSDERKAGNTPIQGSAADIMKLAQLRVYQKIAAGAWPFTGVKMCAQIHDEIILEVPANEEQLSEMHLVVRDIMETPPLPGFTVAIEAEASLAEQCWGMKKPYHGKH